MELPLPRSYGTLESSGSASSATLYEDQLSITKNAVGETLVEIRELTTSPKYLAGISHAKFWLIFGCICWNEFVSDWALISPILAAKW